MMHKITTIYWIPGTTVHNPLAFQWYHFVVALHVDVVDWKVLAYTIRLREGADIAPKPALIDLRHPYRFWLWQADRLNLSAQTACVISTMRPTRLDYDTFGPWRVVRELPPVKLAYLTDRLMKGFYDIDTQYLAHLWVTIRITSTLLLQRIDGAIQYANGLTNRCSLPSS